MHFIYLYTVAFFPQSLGGGVGVGVAVHTLACKNVFLKNGGCCGRDGGGLGKTQRSAIILKHAGPYLCHKG